MSHHQWSQHPSTVHHPSLAEIVIIRWLRILWRILHPSDTPCIGHAYTPLWCSIQNYCEQSEPTCNERSHKVDHAHQCPPVRSSPFVPAFSKLPITTANTSHTGVASVTVSGLSPPVTSSLSASVWHLNCKCNNRTFCSRRDPFRGFCSYERHFNHSKKPYVQPIEALHLFSFKNLVRSQQSVPSLNDAWSAL